MAIRIITDSACDLTPEKAKALHIDILPIKTLFGDQEFLDGVTMSHEEFFERLVESDQMPTTSQVTPYEYEEKFEEIKAAGDQAICITISAKLSGCYQSAHIAREDYEDVVTIVDSANASVGEQLLVLLAARLRDEGKGLEEIVGILEKQKEDIRVIALLDTMEYLKRGGRISAATAVAGAVLSIKPVIAIQNGEVVAIGKARGSKNGNNLLKELIKKEGGIDFKLPYLLAYTGLSDALLKKYAEDSKELYNCAPYELPVSTIGSSVGTHIGPGAIALAFYKEN